jgi:hypothetical protein
MNEQDVANLLIVYGFAKIVSDLCGTNSTT